MVKRSVCFRFALTPLVVFAIATAVSAHAQTFSVVYNFGTQANDPAQSFYSGIIAQGRDGNLYTSSNTGGGPINSGVAYSMTPSGTLANLVYFGGGSGSYPDGGLTLGTDGNFYGTTYGGGFSTLPWGTVFKMTPTGGFKTLYTFTDGTDGAMPFAPPIQGTDGNFYGTTCGGCNGGSGFGSIYKITPSGTFTTLFTCDGTICYGPFDPLVQGTDGNFYGTSSSGGTLGRGTVFKITPTGKITVLYSFSSSGGAPYGPLIQGSDGNFYGTTCGASTYGTVFRMTPAGKLTVLHSMSQAKGWCPAAGLVQATDGNFYGATVYGGAVSANCPSGCGTVFKITSKGVFTVVHNFDLTDGQLPYTTLFQHTNGVLYGTTQLGGTGNVSPCGAGNCGVFYSLNINAAPFVRTVSASGKVGAKIEILGQNFSSSSVVTFGSAPATAVTVGGPNFLTATVPALATTGAVTVTTTAGTLTCNKTFRVTPQFKTFTPPSGTVGTPVTITGISLTQASKVTFGGIAATAFTVNSDTQITAAVPTGALTGKIAITTPGGAAVSATDFTVTP